MSLKKYNENPRVTDTILFEITTPDAEGCFLADPFKIVRVIIYKAERNFLVPQFGEIDVVSYEKELEDQVLKAEKKACENPTEENIAEAQRLRELLYARSIKDTVFFKEAIPVEVFGSEEYPAWISTDIENSILKKVEEDENGNPLYGHFELTWDSGGKIREGQYFICWTWTPLPAGDPLSAYLPFTVFGDPKSVISTPIHQTPNNKYITLLERYLPEMYKQFLCDGDITPQTTQKLNEAIADGFTFVEDIAVQLIDLFDANALHESLLMYLSNLFNLRLKSDDPTLWRRQIKRAIPLYKKKGTKGGLEEAFANSGMKLLDCKMLWQIRSPYVFAESFLVEESTFKLISELPVLSMQQSSDEVIALFTLTEEILLPLDLVNFKLKILRRENSDWTDLTEEYVHFENDVERGESTMTWVGDKLSANALELEIGDIIWIQYTFREVPNDTEQLLTDYILSLPLIDRREIRTLGPVEALNAHCSKPDCLMEDSGLVYIDGDEITKIYPPKNWVVHALEPDDPLFNVLVPNRHPYADFVTFGFVRTEFPYSENIYNMEEYNGSLRPSKDPCDVDKEFFDCCNACLSSSYNIDIEIEDISNNRLAEARDILDEYTPFHAQPFMIRFAGKMVDFVQSPVETIEILITYKRVENIIAANDAFYRVREFGDSLRKILRDELASKSLVATHGSVIYNNKIQIGSPEIDFKTSGVSHIANIMVILSPSPNSGSYTLTDIESKTATVSSPVLEPINKDLFTFNVENIIASVSSASITQIDSFIFYDETIDFTSLGVVSSYDTDEHMIGSPWKIKIPSFSSTPYIIKNVMSDGKLILEDNGSLPVVGGIGLSYELLTDAEEIIISSAVGKLSVVRNGLLDVMDSSFNDVSNVMKLGDLAIISGTAYKIQEFNDDPEQMILASYSAGNMAGIPVEFRRRIINHAVGNFVYSGITLDTSPRNFETEFGILNGSNGPADQNLITDNNLFKENFLIEIGDDFYKIEEIDGSIIKLGGFLQDFTTLASGGTFVNYNVYHFEKLSITIPAAISGGPPDVTRTFDQINRGGNDLISSEIEISAPLMLASLQSKNGAQIQDIITTESKISFEIEYKNGKIERGEI